MVFRLAFRPAPAVGLFGGTRLHAARYRWQVAFSLRFSREKGLSCYLGLMVRLPLRPAWMAGTLRRTERPEFRSHHSRRRYPWRSRRRSLDDGRHVAHGRSCEVSAAHG